MKKLNDTQTQYESMMEFAVLGKNNERLNMKTLIATKKIKKEKTKNK